MNPELLRNFWLEFSVRRLIAMPLVLAILFAAPLIREHPKHAEPPATVTLFQSPFPDADTSITMPVVPNFGMNNLPNSTLLLNLLLTAGNSANLMAGNSANFAVGGLIFFVAIAVLLFLWGTRLAADSLFAEVNGRTWDSQRSSAIGPWATSGMSSWTLDSARAARSFAVGAVSVIRISAIDSSPM